MAMIADELTQYQTTATLTANTSELDGIRLGTNKGDEPYVYLSQDGEDVICCSGKACIRVLRATVSQVFNSISSLAEQMHRWEQQLSDIIYSGCGLDQLIKVSSKVLGNPIFIIDERDIVFAMTDHPLGTVDQEWDHMLRHGRMPYNRISAIYHDSDFKRLRRSSEYDKQPFVFHPPGSSSRGINFRIPDPAADSFLGTLCIVENHQRLTEGLLHKSRILTQAVIKWTRLHEHDHNMKNISHLFTDLLDGVRVDEGEIAMTKSLNEMENDLFILAVIPPDHNDSPPGIAHVLENEIPRSLCFEYNNSLLTICAYDQGDKTLSDTLREIAKDAQVRVGLSYPFSDWRALRSAFKQANIALGYGRERLSRLNSHSAMNYLVSELSMSLQGSNIDHPALQILESYDVEHGTQLFNTLYTFLRCERNLVKTAAALFIHRNSLVYRIARINELIDADLDEYAVRNYLLLSFQCHEASSKIKKTKDQELIPGRLGINP